MAEGGPAAAAERAVRTRLRDCATTRVLADGRLTPITGGLSNHTWRLDGPQGSWFVRLGHPGAARLGVDRVSECALLHAVASAGLAPEVLACEPAAGLLVTRFIEGRCWLAADAAQEGNLRRLAGRLRLLHSLPVPEGIGEVDYARQARQLATDLAPTDGRTDRLRAPAEDAFARIAAHRRPRVLCHHDLHPLNLLDTGDRLWLVDWEYGGRGDPLLDVAGFLALHDLGPGPSRTFLTAYGCAAFDEPGLLDAARWAFDYVQWLWYRSRFPDPAGEVARYTEGLAQRLLRCNN